MEKLTAKIMTQLLKDEKEIVFKAEIDQLKKGEALKVAKSEWTKITAPNVYYPSKKMKGIVTVKMKGDFFFIIKLQD